MPSPVDVESRTRSYGRAIFERLDRRGPLLFTPAWLDERMMEWTMGDEAVKVQLFRFIDVLPQLTDPRDIARHLREYFAQAGPKLAPWMRAALPYLPQSGLGGRLLAFAARTNATRLARRFIAGSNVDEALDTVRDLRKRKLTFTVDLLGEATVTEAEAEDYQRQYLELVEGLAREVNTWSPVPLIDRDQTGPIPRVNVSVNFSSLYSQFDPIDPEGTSRQVRERLRPILRLARQHRVFVNVDMEQFAYKDATLRIFREVLDEDEFRDWADVGIAIQAYLVDCEHNLEELYAWAERRGTPIWVRLVKGAYWDYETVMAAQLDWPVPVFTHKPATDANYEKLTRFLMERWRVLRPALGSHNIRSLAFGLATAEALGLPAGSWEMQMLYGMADPIKEAMVSLGQRVRVYTPYGQLLPGMAYLVRRLLENTANESFLRASFTEHVSEDQLLMNPALKPAHGADAHARHDSNGQPASFKNEPLTDFSREANRASMKRALDEVRGQLGRTYPLVIDNRPITTDATLDSVNPSRFAEVVGRSAKASPAQAEQAIAAARRAFPAWRDTPVEKRAEYLFAAAKVMRRRRFELAAWTVLECGKQWREADGDIAEAIDFCDYYAHEMVRLSKPRRRNVPGEDNEYFYEPRGVTVVIAPWNFPLAILCGMTAAGLVAGNPVIMKPAEQSPIIAAKLMEIFQEVGLPEGVCAYLPGVGEEIGPVLTQHRDVAVIAFTGSKPVGLLINRVASDTQADADHVKKVIAEMGGKNAVIVDSDADLDEAVHGVVASAFGYAGQKCSACSRVLIHESIHDRLLERIVEATKSLTVGPADDPGFAVGPVIDAEAQKRIESAIERGKSEARLVYAANVAELAKVGHFVGPHVFADVPPNSSLAQEEIFGPVLAVMKTRDLDHALEIANGTRYALTGGLFSRSPENIARVRREFRVGNLYINRKITGALVDRQPFGGFKLSGIGSKAGGPDYLLQFLQPRAITENTLRRGFAPTTESGTDDSDGAGI